MPSGAVNQRIKLFGTTIDLLSLWAQLCLVITAYTHAKSVLLRRHRSFIFAGSMCPIGRFS